MNNYMIDIDLPDRLDEEFMQLIPHQRAYTNLMMKKGIIRNYLLSVNRRKLWIIVHASSMAEVRDIIRSFPIYAYLQFKIHSLLFHNTSNTMMPQLWLN